MSSYDLKAEVTALSSGRGRAHLVTVFKIALDAFFFFFLHNLFKFLLFPFKVNASQHM